MKHFTLLFISISLALQIQAQEILRANIKPYPTTIDTRVDNVGIFDTEILTTGYNRNSFDSLDVGLTMIDTNLQLIKYRNVRDIIPFAAARKHRNLLKIKTLGRRNFYSFSFQLL